MSFSDETVCKVKAKYKYRREKFVTEHTIRFVIGRVREAMNSGMDGHYIDEYGHYRLTMDKMNVTPWDWGYRLSCYGSMGDDGWFVEILIPPRCNLEDLRRACVLEFDSYHFGRDSWFFIYD